MWDLWIWLALISCWNWKRRDDVSWITFRIQHWLLLLYGKFCSCNSVRIDNLGASRKTSILSIRRDISEDFLPSLRVIGHHVLRNSHAFLSIENSHLDTSLLQELLRPSIIDAIANHHLCDFEPDSRAGTHRTTGHCCVQRCTFESSGWQASVLIEGCCFSLFTRWTLARDDHKI